MSDLARFSNGNLFYYPDYEYYQSGLKFTNELYNALTRSIGWEAVFRVRTSTGFNQIGTYGNKLIKQKFTNTASIYELFYRQILAIKF